MFAVRLCGSLVARNDAMKQRRQDSKHKYLAKYLNITQNAHMMEETAQHNNPLSLFRHIEGGKQGEHHFWEFVDAQRKQVEKGDEHPRHAHAHTYTRTTDARTCTDPAALRSFLLVCVHTAGMCAWPKVCKALIEKEQLDVKERVTGKCARKK